MTGSCTSPIGRDLITRLRNGAAPLDDPDLNDEAADRIERLTSLLAWSYSKLVYRSFDSMDDALKMDEIKLLLEHKA